MTVNREKPYRPNLNEIAYQEIKNMILTGELAQGERILLDKMAERMNLSITPVREALNKLAQEDLILMKPRTSYEVVQLDDDDINDILDIRELLETFALRTAGSGLKTFPVTELRELFRRPYPPDQYRQFIEADIGLHEAIIGAAKNRKLKKLFDMIYNGIRIIAIPSARVEGRMAESNREHLALLDAIERGDVEEALRQLSHHIQQVKRLMLPNRGQALTGEKN
ncbi:MAG: GntR family transcriptional regulator [Desulfobulbales bacterium]|nr:GntR family transcriptional regulator [Desulfobulbales bacterium]